MIRVRPYEVIKCRDEEHWLQERHKRVTGSDVASLFGEGYLSHEELLSQKRAPFPPKVKVSRYMQWGSECEVDNMRIFCTYAGMPFRHTNMFLSSTLDKRLGSTLDGLAAVPRRFDPSPLGTLLSTPKRALEGILEPLRALPGGEIVLLEMKQAELPHWDYQKAKEKLERLSEGPGRYFYQVQCQLLVTGLRYAIVVIRIGAADMRFHVVEADQLVHEEILDANEEFWSLV